MSVVLAVHGLAASGTIGLAEYRIDGGPSEPLAQVATDDRDEYWEGGFSASVDSSGLSVGAHWLEVRMQGSNGVWSNWQGRWFHINGEPVLTGGEWFIDSDPGPGNGTPIAAPVDGAWDEAEEEVSVTGIDSSGLAEGHRHLFIRFRDSDGSWGTPMETTFHVSSPLVIAAAELTTDPGDEPGSGHPFAVIEEIAGGAGTFRLEGEFATALGGDTVGHDVVFYVRARDSLGRWSTRGGYAWNAESAAWVFDPDAAWEDGVVIGRITQDIDYDNWLAANFTAAEIAAGVVTARASDPDGDGLTNEDEYGSGTDPLLRDTDGDLFSDGFEFSRGWNPAQEGPEGIVSADALATIRGSTRTMNDLGLYTLESIRDLRPGQLLEVDLETGEVQIELQMESSDNLSDWNPNGDPYLWTDAARDKSFYRFLFNAGGTSE
ncbi:hypothetical protein [Luteolibacter marinus]|uniref:hypothetical protein n=1 Tax=Luteolibacter marinus TaxID=2776705 RepID=UPI001865ECCC|nr:hypothetical protein [Luteolibacter marinus]